MASKEYQLLSSLKSEDRSSEGSDDKRSRTSSLDSRISESDSVEKINEKNMRLKAHLQDLIDKTDEQINKLHEGIPMEIKLSRKQL